MRPIMGWSYPNSAWLNKSWREGDANQANKEMTKDSHYEKSSQQSSEGLTKDLADLTRKEMDTNQSI